MNKISDDRFDNSDDEIESSNDSSFSAEAPPATACVGASAWRDAIAERMWTSFQASKQMR